MKMNWENKIDSIFNYRDISTIFIDFDYCATVEQMSHMNDGIDYGYTFTVITYKSGKSVVLYVDPIGNVDGEMSLDEFVNETIKYCVARGYK